jgi:CubicO group peptidase (beta-lactamase class C family)
MQLVDACAVQLGDSIRSYLPEVSFADNDVAERITVRQLLSHSSGLDGDYVADFGESDDCLERYVQSCARLPQIGEPGEVFSYCNAGYVVLARVVEIVTGLPWRVAVHQRILEPMDASHTQVSAPSVWEQCDLAAGHIVRGGAKDTIAPPYVGLPTALGPAAGMWATPSAIREFGLVALHSGVASNGARILTKESIIAMKQPQIEIPEKAYGDAMGLGWAIKTRGDSTILRQEGPAFGQHCWLVLSPDLDLAIALAANSSAAPLLYQDLLKSLGGPAGELTADPSEDVVTDQTELRRFVGVYKRTDYRVTVELTDGNILTITTEPWIGASIRINCAELLPVDETSFIARVDELPTPYRVSFSHFIDGRPQYVHLNLRAARRI